MVPRVVACPACNLRMEGQFVENEFAGLEPEWLHLLRIFVHCEGRITDMESALGISYPTVKARIAELKQRLGTAPPGQEAPPSPDEGPIADILAALEAGEIDYDEAMRRITHAG